MKFLNSAISVIMTCWLAACTQLSIAAVNIPSHFENGFTTTTANFGPADWQKLDIYAPDGATAQTPVVIFFYGGRWEEGARGDYAFVGTTLAQQGYIAVIPDYRKYPQVKFPVFVQDGADAVAWVHANYPGHDLHIMGHSAGAHIGALLIADKSYLAAHHLTPAIIKNFVGLAGPYDFTPTAPDEGDLRDIFGPAARYPLMQVTTYITGHEPPMLLLHGDADKDVGAFNHEKLAAKIRAKGGRVKVITYPGADHVDMVKAFSWVGVREPIRQDVFDYLQSEP